MKFIVTFFTNSLLFVLVFLHTGQVMGQDKPYLRSYTPTSGIDTIRKDSLKKDSLKIDTSITDSAGLDAQVKYSARDSTIGKTLDKKAYLYGNARISYKDFELSADYIELDKASHTIFAKGITDKRTGKYTGRPIFKQGAEPPAAADSMLYNYETGKGQIIHVSTEVEGGFLQAQTSKKNQYDEVSFKGGKYSTCNLPHPHYYIGITKGIVFDKQIVTGPAYLVIEDVPFPAIIPFGFFPKTNKRSSGILLPTFGEEGVRGFFMRDLGYYVGLNEYWDAEVRGTLYSKGSYEGSLNARYRKNYKYDGSVNFRYASTRTGIEGTPQYKPSKDFNIQWSHSQRNEANPGTTFSASVNAGTSSYNTNTGANGTYNALELTRNSLQSRVSYGKTFGDGLFNFTTGLSHSQETATKQISLTLPEFSLTMASINPFDSKDRTGEQKWYQKISVGYSANGSNSITTKENLLFKSGSLRKFTNGVQHSISTNFSSNILQYFQFSAGIPYNERWTFQTIRKSFDPVNKVLVVDTVPGFARSSEYSIGGNVSTKLYGQVNFKRGRTLAIRHTMTPSIGFSYHPDFSESRYGYYRSFQSDITGLNLTKYSIFEQSLYGAPAAGRSGSINFALDNTIEAKKRTKGDTSTTTEKVPIIQGLSFSGSYNLAATEYQLSNISMSGRTAFFHQKLGINFFGAFDPYFLNDVGKRVNEYALSHGAVARLTSFGLSTDFSFNSAAAKSRSQGVTQANQNRPSLTEGQSEALDRISRDPNAFVDFNIPWNINLSYSFNYSKPQLDPTITNTLNFSGDFNVTPKWKVQYNSGYDFQLKKVSFTRFSIYRDLHCWDMSFDVVPFGTYRSYSVDIKVRASILQDLKLSRRRDFYTNF